MVKYTYRKYYKKYTPKATKRQFNYIASHYLKYKIKGEYQFTWQEGITGDYVLTFDDMLSGQNNDFTLMRHHFLMYKLTGIAITIVPTVNTNGDGAFSTNGNKAAICLMPIQDDSTYENVSRNPNSIALGKEKITKYFKINTPWTATTAQTISSLKLVALADGNVLYGSINYAMLLTIYLTFKNPA